MKKFSIAIILITIIFIITILAGGNSNESNSIASSASDFAGQQGEVAAKSVVRIICKKTGNSGTGFFHKSGRIISVGHAVANCDKESLMIVNSMGKELPVESVIADMTLDLSLITLAEKIDVPALPISKKTDMKIGTRITTWGFPAGYNWLTPLLTVGYLAGVDQPVTELGVAPIRWVVNAAFNSGNSGGPIIDDDGEVIGVVVSKLLPVPQQIQDALQALANQKTGFTYIRKYSDGRVESLTEGQIIGEVLQYLRGQTQLVLGHAVTAGDLMNFLKANGVE